MVTEAQKRAQKKYEQKLAKLTIRLSKEEAEEIRKYAERKGIPMVQLVKEAVKERIKNDR